MIRRTAAATTIVAIVWQRRRRSPRSCRWRRFRRDGHAGLREAGIEDDGTGYGTGDDESWEDPSGPGGTNQDFDYDPPHWSDETKDG